jgi:hypothetical protein
MEGWIKLHRKIRNNPIFNDLELYRLATICLTEAYHKEVDQPIGNRVIKIEPGQFPTGRFDLHKMYNSGLKKKDFVSEKTTWRWLKKLEKLDFLTIKSTNKYSVVSINNWSMYQKSDQQMTNRWPTDDQQMTTNKNVKNEKNDKNVKEEKTIREIKNLRASFPSDLIELVDTYWSVIKKTRKTNTISYNVILQTMKKWTKYDPIVIKFALKKHIESYADGERDEKYTLGIMRNTMPEEADDLLNKKVTQLRPWLQTKGAPNYDEPTRSNSKNPKSLADVQLYKS